MARGAAQARRKAAKTQTQRKSTAARRPPTVEQSMFFPRLRRQAKWMFLLLAFVFAGGFVFFGVGSGSGIGDLLRGNFNIFGNSGSTTSSGVKSALKRTKKNPNDAAAWTALANAYSSDGKLGKANGAFEHVLKLRPNDLDALQRVAGYYENQATAKQNQASTLMAQAPLTLASVSGISASSPIGQMLGQDQVTQQLSQKANGLYSDAQTLIQKDEQLYKRIAKLQPDDVSTQFHYAQLADYLADTNAAIAAYQKVVKLAPTDPAARQARQRIAALKLAAGTGTRG
jgi:cytochrome c-type biogenesis protein CcmH/NrfG